MSVDRSKGNCTRSIVSGLSVARAVLFFMMACGSVQSQNKSADTSVQKTPLVDGTSISTKGSLQHLSVDNPGAALATFLILKSDPNGSKIKSSDFVIVAGVPTTQTVSLTLDHADPDLIAKSFDLVQFNPYAYPGGPFTKISWTIESAEDEWIHAKVITELVDGTGHSYKPVSYLEAPMTLTIARKNQGLNQLASQ